MSPEDNKKKAEGIVQAINSGNLDRLNDYFTADYTEHTPLPPGLPTGIEGFKIFMGGLRAALPDLHFTIEDTFVNGDHVVQRVTGQGTMKNSLMGIPPTGKHALWSEIHDVRLGPNGKFVEHWGNVDQMSMMTQLGLAPAPGS